MADTITDRAIESIVKQFRGGEHSLAGQRASQLVYGGAKSANQTLLDRIVEAVPGIDRYIAAPETPVTMVDDQGGNPLATQPENDPQQNNRSNLSTDAARAEQDKIDKRLKAGRKRAQKAAAEAQGDKPATTTELNPEDSPSTTASAEPFGNPAA